MHNYHRSSTRTDELAHQSSVGAALDLKVAEERVGAEEGERFVNDVRLRGVLCNRTLRRDTGSDTQAAHQAEAQDRECPEWT
jgi:hypothetical protein